MTELENINLYWDQARGIVGVTASHHEMRAEEPINGRTSLTDSEILALVDQMLAPEATQ